MKHHHARALFALCMIGAATAAVSHAQAAPGFWFTESPMPQAVFQSATAIHAGQLYVISGDQPAGGTVTNNQVYNPATDTWSTQAPIPTGVAGANAGTIGTKIYVAGGCAANSDCRIGTTNAVQVFNTATNSWSTTTSMQTARSGGASGVIAGKFYVVGGQGACPPCTPLSALEAYSPITHLWVNLASMPTARSQMGGGVISGRLYVVGGSNSSGVTGTLEVYDPLTNTWATKSPMPTPRNYVGVAVVGGILYAISGQDSSGNPTKVVEAYNPATNSWTAKASIPTARCDAEPQQVDGLIFVAGSGCGSPSAITTVESFDP